MQEQANLAPEVIHQTIVGQTEVVVAVGDMGDAVGEMVAAGIDNVTVESSHAAVHRYQKASQLLQKRGLV